ncbi:hypothetical protein PRMUPPPA20_22940 [Xylanibacter ruminicola]|jgi:hypothetical protein|uniref:Uncharacterized protein n=1 Tax=Xylanibacter ruminicola TaxID=839 RepID=A0AA37I265_XYLRU|nr:hypothetical protein PRMUPPPA20_22940 [Xylanibacter ruminicola]
MDERRWISDALEAGFWGGFNIRIGMILEYALNKRVTNKPAVNTEWLADKACMVY